MVVKKMSKYTMPLRYYIEAQSQDSPTLSTREKIEIGRKILFDFDYPIFNENYRKTFETHFIRKFYMREIGFETEGLFKFNLETWLLVNMPYFNKMFESELIEFDPLTNTKETTTKKRDVSSESNSSTSGNTSNNGFSRNISSDTPDSRLALTTNDGSGIIEYASNISEDKDTNSQTSNVDSNSSNTGSENDVTTKTGKIGAQTFSKMLVEYRDTFVRIENKIFDEMNQLFMLIY
jgi:hypothetical protein